MSINGMIHDCTYNKYTEASFLALALTLWLQWADASESEADVFTDAQVKKLFSVR